MMAKCFFIQTQLAPPNGCLSTSSKQNTCTRQCTVIVGRLPTLQYEDRKKKEGGIDGYFFRSNLNLKNGVVLAIVNITLIKCIALCEVEQEQIFDLK